MVGTEARKGGSVAWRGMGSWRWPALAGIGVALALPPAPFRAAGGGD